MEYKKSNNTLFTGDCRLVLPQLAQQGVKVQTCITSPPYYGLRDYGCDGQIGLEPTVNEYVANLVEVFRRVREVLADDGTLWLNLGDSYAGSGKGRNADGSPFSGYQDSFQTNTQLAGRLKSTPLSDGLKAKDLIGIPWRVALALQADGWYLRQDIIWTNQPDARIRHRPLRPLTRISLFVIQKQPLLLRSRSHPGAFGQLRTPRCKPAK